MTKLMHRSKGSKGFTLIELMIVILIIAILVAIAIPVFLNARRNAQKRTCQANLRTIEGGFSTYMADAEVYPGTMANMTTTPYQVLKKTPLCGTTGYVLTGGGGEVPPTTICPTDGTGHSI